MTRISDAKETRSWVPYVAPMALFLLLTMAEGHSPPAWYPLLYTAKAAVVTIALFVCARAWRQELRFEARVLPIAILVGLLVLGEWIALDKLAYPRFGTRTAYNPFTAIADPGLRYGFLAVRFLGLAVLVPLMEEVFWRSFVLRYATDPDKWQDIPVGTFSVVACVIMSGLFAVAHPEWLAAFVCAVVYALLLRQTRSLFAVVVAHGVTNAGLGIYVLQTGNWQLW